jgi:hypothetical protein
MKKKYDKVGFANPKIHQAMGNYHSKLVDEAGTIKRDLKRESRALERNRSKESFTINGTKMSLLEFTLLLGKEFPHIGIGSFLYRTVALEKSIEEIKTFLVITGVATIPPVPEVLTGWLMSDEERANKLRLAVIDYLLLLNELPKIVEKGAKAAFSLFVQNRQRETYTINNSKISAEELLHLTDNILNNNFFPMLPFGSAEDLRSYLDGLDKLKEADILGLFEELLFTIFHTEKFPKALLPPLPDIIPKDWLEL